MPPGVGYINPFGSVQSAEPLQGLGGLNRAGLDPRAVNLAQSFVGSRAAVRPPAPPTNPNTPPVSPFGQGFPTGVSPANLPEFGASPFGSTLLDALRQRFTTQLADRQGGGRRSAGRQPAPRQTAGRQPAPAPTSSASRAPAGASGQRAGGLTPLNFPRQPATPTF